MRPKEAVAATARSYDDIPDFGLLYDSVPVYGERRDIQFYVARATEVDGPVLEIGSGTGRVLIPSARATMRPITGLEGSQEMLSRCREKLAAEPADVRNRVTLHAGDGRDFDLGDTFALITAPFRVLQHLTTIDDQLRLLANVRRHLRRDGLFIFDVFNPFFRALASDRSTEREEIAARSLPDGRTMSRSVRIPRVRWVDQVSEIELIYYVTDPRTGETTRNVSAFEMRWYQHAELQHLLARAGFSVISIEGDFDGAPLEDQSPEQVVRCSLAK